MQCVSVWVCRKEGMNAELLFCIQAERICSFAVSHAEGRESIALPPMALPKSLRAERASRLQAGCCKEPLAIPTLQRAGCASPLTALLVEALLPLLWLSRTVISPTSVPGEVLPISQLRKLNCWYYMTCPNNAISCQAETEIRRFENWFITLMIWGSHSQKQATRQASGKAKHTEN